MRASVILPCRNEERHLGACLDSILGGSWPRDRLEVLVVDGRSDDGTRSIAERYAQRHREVRVLDNPRRTAPAALNIGIAHATGDVILRMDAHVLYPADYITRLVRALEITGADNVGGRVETIPDGDAIVARAIARAMAHPFGVGNAHFRLREAAPRWVDTVPFGCWRRESFARHGGFDEELVRNQDDEFNARIRRRGGRILLDPRVEARYFARRSLPQLARMYFQYGRFKPLVVRKVGAITSARQLAPAALLLGLAVPGVVAVAWPAAWVAFGAVLSSYLLASAGAAGLAAREDGARGLLARMAAFGVMHVSYGAGYLLGALRAARAVPSRATSPLPLSR